MRSRQTGQVGSSTRAGVGGAWGLAVSDVVRLGVSVAEVTLVTGGNRAVGSFDSVGAKGSLVRSGYEVGS